jgi:hypothetical protein
MMLYKHTVFHGNFYYFKTQWDVLYPNNSCALFIHACVTICCSKLFPLSLSLFSFQSLPPKSRLLRTVFHHTFFLYVQRISHRHLSFVFCTIEFLYSWNWTLFLHLQNISTYIPFCLLIYDIPLWYMNSRREVQTVNLCQFYCLHACWL